MIGFALSYYEFDHQDRDAMDHNKAVLYDALNTFAEIEEGDPRFMVILSAARMETAIYEAIETFGDDVKRNPSRFQSRMKLARDLGIIDSHFLNYLEAVRKLRNIIAHRPTDKFCMGRGECLKWLRSAFSYSASVPIWYYTIDPAEDLRRSTFAVCLAGVLAAEMDFFDPMGHLVPKGFRPVCEWAWSQMEEAGGNL